jgi:hypothetical protein
MEIVNIFGTLATFAGFAVMFGLVKQALSNFRAKGCGNQDPMLFGLVTFAYAMWTCYAWFKPDWYVFATNLPGVLLAGFVCWQIWYYRKSGGNR